MVSKSNVTRKLAQLLMSAKSAQRTMGQAADRAQTSNDDEDTEIADALDEMISHMRTGISGIERAVRMVAGDRFRDAASSIQFLSHSGHDLGLARGFSSHIHTQNQRVVHKADDLVSDLMALHRES